MIDLYEAHGYRIKRRLIDSGKKNLQASINAVKEVLNSDNSPFIFACRKSTVVPKHGIFFRSALAFT